MVKAVHLQIQLNQLLHKISNGWISFIESKFGEPVTRFDIKNHDIIDDIKYKYEQT